MKSFTDLFLEEIENEIHYLYVEKKTREEYRMEKFKKKHDYNPKDKTIKIDGKVYALDDDIHNPIISGRDQNGNIIRKNRVTAINKAETPPKLYLDDSFFKLKNNKRRLGISEHEIGHVKFNDLDTNQEYKSKNINSPKRDSAKRKLKSFENPDDDSHTKVSEFEADLYAISKVSKNDFKKALREYNKHSRKKLKDKHAPRKMVDTFYKVDGRDPKKFNEKEKYKRDQLIKNYTKMGFTNNEELKGRNIKQTDDYNRRSKILDRKVLSKDERDVYKD